MARDNDETRLNYTSVGEPGLPAVLFLHGFMGSSGDWAEAAGSLDGRAFAVAVDLPGHGASVGLSPETYTVEGVARAIIRVMDDLRVQKASLVGYSMGGRLALYLALRHPERFTRLLLESASPGLQCERERAARRDADEERARRLDSGDFEMFLRDWYRQPVFEPLARDEKLLQGTIEARRRNDPVELAWSLRGMGTGVQPSLWGELAGLRVPALAVTGELDGKFVGISRRMSGISQKVHDIIVPGVGHNVRAEAPRAYSALLRSFFDADPFHE